MHAGYLSGAELVERLLSALADNTVGRTNRRATISRIVTGAAETDPLAPDRIVVAAASRFAVSPPRSLSRPTGHPMTATATVSPQLKRLLRRDKLGEALATLPEWLTLATNQQALSCGGRRVPLGRRGQPSHPSVSPRPFAPRPARLDPAMTLEAWALRPNVTYDRAVWAELDLAAGCSPAPCS